MSQRPCVAFTAVALLVLNAHAFHAFSSLCLSTPPLPLVAGVSNISAIYDVSYWQQCRAFLSFAAEDFPTVTFTFGPKYCMGREVATFLVPADVPNGDAHLIWECSGLPPTCIQASITQVGLLAFEHVRIELRCSSFVNTAQPCSKCYVNGAQHGRPPCDSKTNVLKYRDRCIPGGVQWIPLRQYGMGFILKPSWHDFIGVQQRPPC
ncbi:hypothetical protein FJTKL_04929 [Diaporthe vaccinii]|uniref:Uncharacterized protein n=1 Tax=Diaporthe vaccinii TaxID=105482 RepID=A0ABR4DV82_9PEZI